MKKAILTPNVSVGDIRFDDDIENYPNKQFEYSDTAGEELYSCYSFTDIPVSAFTTATGQIENVKCATECLWQGVNLIGLDYEAFTKLCSHHPDETDRLVVDTDLGEQEQEVFDYDELGLQVWTFENKIVTIMASS